LACSILQEIVRQPESSWLILYRAGVYRAGSAVHRIRDPDWEMTD
jgi:hypothetical protein